MSVGEKVVDGVKINFDVVSSSRMYIAPPLVAVQLVKETVSNVRVFDAGIDTWIAPPFPVVQSQEVNWRFESVCDEEREEDSNTAPFPLPHLIEVNVFVPEVVSKSIDTSISGA